MKPLYDGVLKSVFARNCVVERIDRPTAAAFLEQHHRFGDAACKYRYGLYVRRSTGAHEHALEPGALVAVAEFSGARRWQKGERKVSSYEWVRYASLPDVTVVGGMGKVMERFIEDVNPDDIMTYANKEWSEGEVYKTLGFVEEEPKVFPDGSVSLKFRLKLSDY